MDACFPEPSEIPDRFTNLAEGLTGQLSLLVFQKPAMKKNRKAFNAFTS